ncbi:MAG: glycine cleavage system protein GcvH [Deltaproteobacteria bacterium]|nr:glycine cleavage system protein GcvH [Deltaproteobacteria bacterium]
MEIDKECKFTKEHEWIRLEDNVVTVGITDYAQTQLGDVVFVELPDEGDTVTKGESLGVVESVKAVSDIFAPVSGEIIAANSPLKDQPEQVNADCYGEGWMVRIEMSNIDELEDLMSPDDYATFVAAEHG